MSFLGTFKIIQHLFYIYFIYYIYFDFFPTLPIVSGKGTIADTKL